MRRLGNGLVLLAAGLALVAVALMCVLGIVWVVEGARGNRWWLLVLIPCVWWLVLFVSFVREWAWPELRSFQRARFP